MSFNPEELMVVQMEPSQISAAIQAVGDTLAEVVHGVPTAVGMSEDRQRRLVEWYLYNRTEDPKYPRNCR